MTSTTESQNSAPAGRTAAQRLGDWVAALTYEGLPEPVVEAAKLHAIDTIGVGIAGAVLPGEAATARTTVALFGRMGGTEEASVVGLPDRLPAANAAFANGSLDHSIDFDDIDTDSRVHASTIVTPAAFAIAERTGADGRELIAALVAGNEVATRIGMGGPVHFQAHGFHATLTAGVFGAAASAARLLGLSGAATTNAFGIAGDTAGGLNAWIEKGTPNKHLHAGWAAHNGIISADLAALGAEGPATVFEGRFGLYEALTGYSDVDMSRVLDSLGADWETPKMAYKAYPSCYWMHGSLDAAREIRDRIARELEQIDTITAIVPTSAVSIVLEPRDTRIRPLTPYAGKFSLQYSVAAMLLRGEVDLDTYTTARMADDTVLDLTARVEYAVSEKFDSGRQVYPGGLAVRMLDGREFVVETPEPRGTELNPMSVEEVTAKFRSTASFGLADPDVATLEDALRNLESPGSIGRAAEVLRRVRRR